MALPINQLPVDLINILNDVKNNSKANKRKVAALIFDSQTYQPYDVGVNHNLFVPDVCEDKNNETLDTVIHAEQDAIFTFYENMHQNDSKNGFNMLVSYSPCIECVKQIILAGIKNVYVMEEHDVNFRKPQFNSNSLSPLEALLQAGIKVFKHVDGGNFNQITTCKKKALVWHSKDLDGFMSRYLFETFVDHNKEYEYHSYNYEPDAEWMHQNYVEITFIDVTPPKAWIESTNTSTKIVIFDHHLNTAAEITKDLDVIKQTDYAQYIKYEFSNQIIYFLPKGLSNLSACKLFYIAILEDALPDIADSLYTYINYISLYDTWSFKDYENANTIFAVIESLKLFSYPEFKEFMDNERIENVSELDELIAKGTIIRELEISNINKALETALVISFKDKFKNAKEFQHLKLVICERYPNYELEKILRDKFENCPIIFIGYSINTVDKYISYSVRYYPLEYETIYDVAGINALKIAKIFDGGGHINAAGFRTTIYDGLNMIESKYSNIVGFIDRKLRHNDIQQ